MRTSWKGWKALMRAMSLVLMLSPALSFAQIDAGILWLKGQQQADGSIYTIATKATPIQASAEALLALASLDASNSDSVGRAMTFIQANNEGSAEYLARQVFAGVATGANTSSRVLQLLALANADGGIAPALGYSSSVLDSAFALSAMRAAGTTLSPTIEAAIAYLVAAQKPSGGWAIGANNVAPYPTALASMALQRYRFEYSVGSRIAAASDFLLQAQLPEGGWGSTIDTSLALLALIPVTTDSTRYATALERLRTGQQQNGSWEDDVFTTALALRALYLAKNATVPTDPLTGTVTAQVLDDASGAVLAGVSVTVQGATSIVLQTGSDGRFTASGLLPGPYTVSYAKAGFLGAMQTVEVNAGQQINLGTVRLASAPDTALLFGIVTSAADGKSIPGAVISVAGAGSVSTSTAADGSYSLQVTPGAMTITVSAQDFVPVTASGSAAAGGRLNFSPTLVKVGSEPPGSEPPLPSETVTLRGVVIDANTSLPLSDATVALIGSALSIRSDADGKFVLPDVPAGELKLEITRANYEPLVFNVITAPGTIADIGMLRLRPVNMQTTIVSGTVLAIDTGNPLPGALVTAAGLESTADAAGRFRIEGISASSLQFSILASATGYLTASRQISLSAPGNVSVDIELQRAETGGLKMLDVTSDRTSYDAYSEVALAATLQNSSDRPRVVRLYLNVYDAANEMIEQRAAVMTEDDPTTTYVTVAPGTDQTAPAYWNTSGHAPGQYRLVVQAFDAYEGTMLAESVISVQIVETRQIEILVVKPEPVYLTQGTSAEILFSAQLLHRSNVAFVSSIGFSILSPNGQVLYTASVDVPLEPAVAHLNLPLGGFSHIFVTPGEYQVRIDSVSGLVPKVQQARPLYVAPNTRVEIEQAISPKSVVPDADKQINIQIRLNGVAQ